MKHVTMEEARNYFAKCIEIGKKHGFADDQILRFIPLVPVSGLDHVDNFFTELKNGIDAAAWRELCGMIEKGKLTVSVN